MDVFTYGSGDSDGVYTTIDVKIACAWSNIPDKIRRTHTNTRATGKRKIRKYWQSVRMTERQRETSWR